MVIIVIKGTVLVYQNNLDLLSELLVLLVEDRQSQAKDRTEISLWASM